MNIAILAGENWLGIKQVLDERVNAFVEKHGELAVEKIDGSEASMDEITGAISTQSLLMPEKLCVIYNLSANNDAVAGIEQILNLPSENTKIIIVEGKLDKRSSYYKTLKKQAGFQEFNQLDEQGTINWLMSEAKRLGGTLSRSDAQYLYSRVGGNQSRLANELKKLVDYSLSISKESVNELTKPTPSSTIFDLLNAVFSGNQKQAMSIYDEQRLQKVEPQQILAMIGWQMHIVAVVKSAKDINPADLAKKASINPFVIQKSRQIALKLDNSQIKKILAELVDTDWSIKNKSIDADDALKNLLIGIGE
jgi:DNA polymerase III subunit delta